MTGEKAVVATTIAVVLAKLVEEAQRHDLPLLAFMLEQARLEAQREVAECDTDRKIGTAAP